MHLLAPLRTSVLALAMVAMQALLADAAPSPPIRVSIHSSWAAPPFLLEILYVLSLLCSSSLSERVS